MDKIIQIFNSSLQTGYVDKNILSDLAYQPELLVNQKNPPKKVLSTILHELENCNQFYISVAFVTTSGVATIINKLKELENREITGQILVSQYLNFTQPEALKRLSQFKNIDLRIATTGNAHAKGYIFKNKEHYNLIVGSSNLTASALSTNKEWNIKVSALDESGLVDKVLGEFQTDFEKSTPVTTDYILRYEEIYKKQFLTSRIEGLDEYLTEINPNAMQVEALRNLDDLRKDKKDKALIISATGTGKTYLSAFDAKAFNAKKLLFVVHRLTIAKDSLKTFQKVFGKNKTMGLYSGEKRDLECDFVFSTIQTISKFTHLENFSKDHFDYIIIDETHRSGADSYLRLIDYFEPKFLLGMTATPERTDGDNIFQLFGHNIAYEIRLNRAMEEEMLSPFHYYGVTDLIIENNEIENKSDFNLLVSTERVKRVIEQATFYGSDNGITRGLVFCSRKKEAIELSVLFNLNGYKTVALTGDSTEEERVIAIDKLESDNLKEKIDYIFTVDIFNEGIDIPKINQIIMLRPTESAIIFIQQLGRGLRKIEGKSYVTVIDFIGNYENSYLIPIALYGDTSYNKDSLRKLITEGSRMIPGSSTINFDEITKEKIFQSIDSANMQLFSDLKKDYNLLKFKLGRIPMMMDFIEHGSRDPYLYVNYAGSHYNFIAKVEQEYNSDLNEKQVKLLELFSKEINNSKRVEESIIINLLIKNGKLSLTYLKEFILNKYHYIVSDETIQSCITNLNFEFIREKKEGKLISVKEIYNLDIIKFENDSFMFSNIFSSYLSQETFKIFLVDSTDYSIYEFDKLFEPNNWQQGFLLYRKYSRKDVFRILNTKENPVAQNVGGYLVSPDNSHCPIFVNYHKEEDISESTKYEDKFVNAKEFDWMSKSNRKINSNDVQSILGKNGAIRLPLFIKKNNDEGMDFYYMGEVSPELNQIEQTTMNNDNGKQVSVVKIRFNLASPVSPSMYNYLEEKVIEKAKRPKKKVEIDELKTTIKFEPILHNPIPLYDFYAAAGTFSEIQSEKEFTLIEGPINSKSDYFACKIVGESMSRVISNGSICMFKPYTGGSRNGKIVLVENIDIQDTDFNSAFTIKTYSSEKVVSEDGWEHTLIALKPNSFDSSYKDIIINEENGASMRVVGEFVSVITGI
ncbi:MAG: restriction endonuclease subunit R [Flavobacteriales bacterium 32-34-25]|nr:MAG: restriction endonuclease subunit R [Flavobacteriales bacterium 32-34-25]